MSMGSVWDAIARTPLPSLVLEPPRLGAVAVQPRPDGLRIDVALSVFGLVPLGEIHASARFTAVLERLAPDGSTVRRTIASIESCDAAFTRQGLGSARAILHLGAPSPQLFGRRIGASEDDEVTLLDPVWTDLVLAAHEHRLSERIRGRWSTPGQPASSHPA